MLCVKCGNLLDDDAKLCPLCGRHVGLAPDEEEMPYPDPREKGRYQAPHPIDTTDPKNGKKKPPMPLLIGAGVVLLAVVVLLILTFGGIRGWVIRSFVSPKNTMLIAYQDAVHTTLDGVSGYIWSSDTTDSYSGQLQLKPSLQILNLVSPVLGGTDLDWLSDISVTCHSRTEGSLTGNQYILSLADTDVLTLDHVIDRDAMMNWLLLPELSKTALSDKLDPAVLMLDRTQLQQTLPSREALEAFCDRYLEIIIRGFTRVELTSQMFTAGEISQKLHVLEARMNEHDLIVVMTDVLEELMIDQELKNILEQLQPMYDGMLDDYMGDLAEIGYGSLYERFLKKAQSLLEQLRSEFYGADIANEIRLYTYLNGSNKIVGSRFEITGMENAVYDSYIITEGTRFASWSTFSGVTATGSGFYDKGIQGSMTVSLAEQEMLELRYTDLKLKDQYITGKLELQPSASFVNLIAGRMELDAAPWLTFAEVAIEIESSGSRKAPELNAAITFNHTPLLALEYTGQVAQVYDISIPERSVSTQDAQALEQWLMSVDTRTLKQKLKSAGVPEQVLGIFAILLSVA